MQFDSVGGPAGEPRVIRSASSASGPQRTRIRRVRDNCELPATALAGG
jgi:hypothetical protein